MKFGRKAGTITPVNTGSGEWPKGLRAGETRVRFLAEIADWQEYWEHFDDTVKFFPCTGDKKTCPGCTSASERTAKATKKYLAPVLDPKSGKVWGVKFGQDLGNRLSLRSDRNGGTITNRDYTLIRTGSGLDTEYDVEQEEKVPIDLSVYAGELDVEQMLSAQFHAAWPDFDPDNPNGGSPAPRKRAPRKAVAKDEDEDQPSGTREQMAAAAEKGRAEQEGYADDPPSEPAPPAAVAEQDTGDETLEITEDDLRNMPRTELIKLARRAELPITLTMSREQIVTLFLEQFAV